jgi:hypothetical protein
MVWEILHRPRHRRRWESWLRATERRGQDGAQTGIAWVITAHVEGHEVTREAWSVPGLVPHRRSAVQRLFTQGATRRAHVPPGPAPIKQLTRSRVLVDIVHAFDLTDAELSELRAAWPEPAPRTARAAGPAELVARLADVVQRLEALEARFTTTQVAR